MKIDRSVRRTLNKLPSYIRVGGSKWSLVLKDAAWRVEHEVHGLCSSDTMTVSICYATTKSEALNTLLHELTHVVWREWNLPERPREERAVTAIGFGWAALYSQNPELLEVIDELARDD